MFTFIYYVVYLYTYLIYSPFQPVLRHFPHIFFYWNKSKLVSIYQSVVQSSIGNVLDCLKLVNTYCTLKKKTNKQTKNKQTNKRTNKKANIHTDRHSDGQSNKEKNKEKRLEHVAVFRQDWVESVISLNVSRHLYQSGARTNQSPSP